MKAALMADGVVQNVIVWDDTCEAPEGYDVVVLEDHVSISIGWVQQGDVIVDPNPLQEVTIDLPPPTVSDLRAQLDAITAQLAALEAK
jgi:hypothetical protein